MGGLNREKGRMLKEETWEKKRLFHIHSEGKPRPRLSSGRKGGFEEKKDSPLRESSIIRMGQKDTILHRKKKDAIIDRLQAHRQRTPKRGKFFSRKRLDAFPPPNEGAFKKKN